MSATSSPATREAVPPARPWYILPGVVALVVLAVLFAAFYLVWFDRRSDRLNDIVRREPVTATPCPGWVGGADRDRYSIPDLQLTPYPPDCLHRWATRLGAGGRAYFVQSQWDLDFVFPAVYGMLFAVAHGVAWGYVRWKRGTRVASPWLLLLPVLAVALDLAENLTVIHLLTDFPNRWSDNLARAASGITLAKGVFFGLSTVAAVVVLRRAYRVWRGGKS